jgi:long-chain acyl-CoA synthetase
MEKIWLKSYPAGVPPEIDMSEYASVNDVFTRTCQKYPDRPAFSNLDTELTYSELDRQSRNFAAWLQSLGIEKDSRVAIMMPNLLQYPIALFGVLRAGMIVVNVNPLYTPRELEHQLRDSGAQVIVILENFANVLEKVLPDTPVKYVVTTQVGDMARLPRRWLVNFVVKRVKKMVPPWRIPRAISFSTALKRGAGAKLDEARPEHDTIALLQYTGGTTGVSKGAILTHGNLVANLLQATAWLRGELGEGGEIAVTALPLYHIFSFTVNCLLFIKLAGVNHLITNPRDLPGLVKEMKKSNFTAMSGVNTLYSGLLNTPGFNEIDFSRVKLSLGGGAAIHRTVAERWHAATGQWLVEGYGLTEASPIVSCNMAGTPYTGTIGLPMPSTEISIRDDNDREVPLGGEGEICVRGPQVMRGYWRRPEDTDAAIDPEGWLRTGDIGVMNEDGFVRVTDRKKDMILVSGFNVYPNEVEGVLAAAPGVVECAVVGVDDPITGEVVKAFIVPENPAVSSEAVVAYCRQYLTNYKVPKLVEFRKDLPKSPIGKVLRRELRTPKPSEPEPAEPQAESTQAADVGN